MKNPTKTSPNAQENPYFTGWLAAPFPFAGALGCVLGVTMNRVGGRTCFRRCASSNPINTERMAIPIKGSRLNFIDSPA
jgi:hypothetical protein